MNKHSSYHKDCPSVLKSFLSSGRNIVSFFPMGKPGHERKARKPLSKMRKEMPFKPEDPKKGRLPRNFKDKQREYILSGLKHIGAPVESRPRAGSICSGFFF